MDTKRSPLYKNTATINVHCQLYIVRKLQANKRCQQKIVNKKGNSQQVIRLHSYTEINIVNYCKRSLKRMNLETFNEVKLQSGIRPLSNSKRYSKKCAEILTSHSLSLSLSVKSKGLNESCSFFTSMVCSSLASSQFRQSTSSSQFNNARPANT